jgi:hypothetical protein
MRKYFLLLCLGSLLYTCVFAKKKSDLTYVSFEDSEIAKMLPLSTTPIGPVDKGSEFAARTVLEWNVAEKANGYKVFFGTGNPPQIMVSKQKELTFDPSVYYNTTYYWQIVPYNKSGDAIECPVWSFTTEDYDIPDTGVHLEGFFLEDTPPPVIESKDDAAEEGLPDNIDVQYDMIINANVRVNITLNHSLKEGGQIEHVGTGIVPNVKWNYAAGTVSFPWKFTSGEDTDTFVIGTKLP